MTILGINLHILEISGTCVLIILSASANTRGSPWHKFCHQMVHTYDLPPNVCLFFFLLHRPISAYCRPQVQYESNVWLLGLFHFIGGKNPKLHFKSETEGWEPNPACWLVLGFRSSPWNETTWSWRSIMGLGLHLSQWNQIKPWRTSFLMDVETLLLALK